MNTEPRTVSTEGFNYRRTAAAGFFHGFLGFSVFFIVFSEFLKDVPGAFHRKCTHAG